MTVEFVDTNILVYAHDVSAGVKHTAAVDLLARLFKQNLGAVSVQVLIEFYSAATKKLPMPSREAEAVISDLVDWTIHRPGHADVLRACELCRRHGFAWWDALIVNSAMELGCETLWTEDLNDGQQFGAVTVRNPFSA